MGSVKRSVWKTYTKCELIFLFPVLFIVSVVSFIFNGLCRRSQKKKKKQNKLTAVLPKTISKSEIEEKTIEEKTTEEKTIEEKTIEEKTVVLDKLRTESERQQSVHDDWDSSSEDENGGRSF